jgi:hypothetical protein
LTRKKVVIKIPGKFLKQYLGNPSWYLWSKCKVELKIDPSVRLFNLTQVKAIIGWFSLYYRSAKNRDYNVALVSYYYQTKVQKDAAGTMESRQILALKDRPSKATLYRRVFRMVKTYTPDQVSALLSKWQL